MATWEIGTDRPDGDDVLALIDTHLRSARAASPPCEAHALDVDGLRADGITFLTAREDGRLLAMGALRQLDATHAEIKSMHTAEDARGRGLGRAMLDHLLSVARDRGCTRVSLETGTMPFFDAARALYASAGFTPCEPFGGYEPSPASVCMTLELT